MNQNSNYNFDPITGQPLSHEQQANYQQLEQLQFQNKNSYKPPNSNGSSNKKNLVILLMIGIFIAILVVVFYFINKNEKESSLSSPAENNQQNAEDIIENKEEENPTDENYEFLYNIEEVVNSTGVDTVVIGQITQGEVKVGDNVQIIGITDEIITVEVTKIEVSGEEREKATVGENANITLKNITQDQVKEGQVLAKPNSITAVTKFDAEVYILTEEEGGRSQPFFTNYKVDFYFGSAKTSGTITLPEEIHMASPGDTVSFTVTLKNNVVITVGTEFSIKEGNRTVGTGTVTKIYEES